MSLNMGDGQVHRSIRVLLHETSTSVDGRWREVWQMKGEDQRGPASVSVIVALDSPLSTQ